MDFTHLLISLRGTPPHPNKIGGIHSVHKQGIYHSYELSIHSRHTPHKFQAHNLFLLQASFILLKVTFFSSLEMTLAFICKDASQYAK
jgi:hypothetical protein